MHVFFSSEGACFCSLRVTPQNLHHEIRAPLRSPPCPKCCTCHENCISKQNSSDPLHLSRKGNFGPPKHEVSLALATKSEPCANAHGTATRAQSRHAPVPATQISRACAVEVHIDDVERHECIVNSSELAAHARAAQRSKHSCFASTVRTSKCVHTAWGKQYIHGASRSTCFSLLLEVRHAQRAAAVSA